LVHSDYSQRGTPVRIAFFDDRIEIETPGILLPGMTIEDMKQGVSKIRNTVISRVFRELTLIEQWGSGIRRMFNEAQALSLPPPEIIEIGMHVRVVVRLAKSIPIAKTPSFVAELTGPGIAPGIESGAELGVESEMALQILACLREARLSKSAKPTSTFWKKSSRNWGNSSKKAFMMVAKSLLVRVTQN
jgi:ATP-dependent DNA helicase RecG